MAKPSPDWDLVTLKWAAVYFDGSPCEGYLTLSYDGSVMLDDDPVTPLNIFPRRITVPLVTTTVMIDGSMKPVGYAEVQVPASNDPDIQGSGGTYSLTEDLKGGGGRSNIHFIADINAPDRTIWLNKVLPTNPQPGDILPVVYYSEFTALKGRVSNIEANGGGGGGGVTSYDQLTDKPTIPQNPADIGAQPAGDYILGTDSRLTDARPPTGHTHPISSVTGLQATLDGKATATHTHAASSISDSTSVGRSVLTAVDSTAVRTAIGAGTSNLTLGSTSSTAKAGDYKPGVADLPAGSTLSVVNVDGTQARPTARTDVFVTWIGGTVAPTNAILNDTWIKDVA